MSTRSRERDCQANPIYEIFTEQINVHVNHRQRILDRGQEIQPIPPILHTGPAWDQFRYRFRHWTWGLADRDYRERFTEL